MDESKGGQAQTVEYVDLPEGRPESLSRLRSWLRRRRRGVAFTLAAVGLMVGGWIVNERVVQPWRDVEAMRLAIETIDDDRQLRIKAWRRSWTPEERLIWIADELYGEAQEAKEARRKGYLAALRQATRHGSAAAHLIWGKALRDGSFLSKDVDEALRHFKTARQLIEKGLQVGDADALWLHSLILAEGLGQPADTSEAESHALRAAKGMASSHASDLVTALRSGSPPFSTRDRQLALTVAERAWSRGTVSVYERALSACITESYEQGITSEEAGRRRADQLDCEARWARKAAEANVPYGAASLGDVLIEQGKLSEALDWYAKGSDEMWMRQKLAHLLLLAATQEGWDAEQQRQLRRAIARSWEQAYQTEGVRVGWLSWLEGGDQIPLTSTQWRRLGARLWDAASQEQAEQIEAHFFELAIIRREFDVYPFKAPLFAGWRLGPTSASSWQRRGSKFELTTTRGSRYEVQVGQGDSLDDLAADIEGIDEAEQPGRPRTWPVNSGTAPSTPNTVTAQQAPIPTTDRTKPGNTSQLPELSTAIDPDLQGVTGYVPGSARLAGGGRSSFTIDNSRGGGDALVRLYQEGGRSAVRSVFVKNGERFKLQGLAAGRYVMRYRYMGSTKTYEADQVFDLQEIEEADGVRFSNVRVTLYQVQDGNMRTKEVPAGQF